MTPRLLNIKKAVAAILGNTCQCCKVGNYWPWEPRPTGPLYRPLKPSELLQVDHPRGHKRSGYERQMNQIQRWRKRLDDAINGKVRALCGPCNRELGCGCRYS